MTWPTVAITTTGMDAGSDTPPRSDILDMAQKVNAMIGGGPPAYATDIAAATMKWSNNAGVGPQNAIGTSYTNIGSGGGGSDTGSNGLTQSLGVCTAPANGIMRVSAGVKTSNPFGGVASAWLRLRRAGSAVCQDVPVELSGYSVFESSVSVTTGQAVAVSGKVDAGTLDFYLPYLKFEFIPS